MPYRAKKVVGVVLFIAVVAMIGWVFMHLPHGRDEAGLADGAANDDAVVRIVSLSPNVTETIYAIGAEGSLIGVTDCCDWPAAAMSKPVVGAYGRPNVERILSIRPTVLLTTERLPEDMVRMFESSGTEVRTLRIGDVDSVWTMFREVGEITGHVAGAERLIESVRSEFDAARRRIEAVHSQPPRLFFEIWNDPLTTIGQESFLSDVVSRIGAVNVAADAGIRPAYPVIDPENVLHWDPDWILLVTMETSDVAAATADARVAALKRRLGWKTLIAVKSDRIVADLPVDELLRAGPRLGQGATAIARHIAGAK